MKLSEFKPLQTALHFYIDRYSLLEINGNPADSNWEKCIPDGFIKLYFFEKEIKGMYSDETVENAIGRTVLAGIPWRKPLLSGFLKAVTGFSG